MHLTAVHFEAAYRILLVCQIKYGGYVLADRRIVHSSDLYARHDLMARGKTGQQAMRVQAHTTGGTSTTHLPLHVELLHATNRRAEESARNEQEKGSRKPHFDL